MLHWHGRLQTKKFFWLLGPTVQLSLAPFEFSRVARSENSAYVRSTTLLCDTFQVIQKSLPQLFRSCRIENNPSNFVPNIFGESLSLLRGRLLILSGLRGSASNCCCQGCVIWMPTVPSDMTWFKFWFSLPHPF